jgi:molybdate transport system permease protein
VIVGASDSPEPAPRSSSGGRGRAGRRAPLLLLAPAAIGVFFLLTPLVGLLIRAPWRGLPRLLADDSVGQALKLSLLCATLATLCSLVIGVPLAWVLARLDFPGRRVLRALVTLPLVLPPVVGGVGLLYAFGRRGVLGPALESMGVSLSFTTTGVVLAEAFVAMPFLVVVVEGALGGADRRYEEAAATLGASTWGTFWRVTLPLMAPSVAAGSVLCFARALGEFGATITFAGNAPGTTQTMPLAVYIALESNPEQAVALALVLLAVSVAILLMLRERWLRPTLRP